MSWDLYLSGLLGHRVHPLAKSFRPGTQRGRILTGDQQAVGEDVRLPVSRLGKDATLRLQLVLDKEGYHLGEANRFLLGDGEAGHGLALNQRLALRGLDMAQRAAGAASA